MSLSTGALCPEKHSRIQTEKEQERQQEREKEREIKVLMLFCIITSSVLKKKAESETANREIVF